MKALEMSKDGYLLLFHSGDWWTNLGREELEKYIAESNAWMEKLIATGKVKGGQGLARTGAIISGKTVRNITDGPYAESKEIVGGYLVLNVESLDEAIALAKTAPNLMRGTSIELRPFTNECPAQARLEKLTREEQVAVA